MNATTHSRSIERPAKTANGVLMLLIGLALLILGPVGVAQDPDTALRVVAGISAAMLSYGAPNSGLWSRR